MSGAPAPIRRLPQAGAEGPQPTRVVVGTPLPRPPRPPPPLRPVGPSEGAPQAAAPATTRASASVGAPTGAAAAAATGAPTATPAGAAPVSPIAVFLDLEQDFRKARDLDTLRTVLVTGARRLVGYDCALFLEREVALARRLVADAAPRWRVRAASGVSDVDRQAPLPQALERLITALAGASEGDLAGSQTSVIDAESGGADLAGLTAGFPHLLWTPVHHPDGTLIGGLATFRATAWTSGDTTLLTSLAGPFGHALAALSDGGWDLRRRVRGFVGRSRLGFGALALALVVLAVPVRFSVLAPAEVVGARPTPVAAPIDGQVRELFVEPGDAVAAGAPLFSLVDTKLRNDVEIALKGRAVALAKHRRVVQSAVANRRDSQDIAVAAADLEVAEAELAMAQDLYARAQVSAPRAGIVVYSAKSDWLGRPVTTGERVMDVVDPQALELRIDLGVSDAMALRTGMAAKLFLDGDPLAAVTAEIGRIGYRPIANAERQMVYRVFADFADGAAPRLGARGTARIDGDRVALGFYLFRRPLAALRQKIGL